MSTVLTSCQKDEGIPTPPMNPVELDDIWFSASQMEMIWNGEKWKDDGCVVYFYKSESDNTRMNVSIGEICLEYVEVELDMIPHETTIEFSGSTASSLKPYLLTVKGVYTRNEEFPEEIKKGTLKIECSYKLKDSVLLFDYPFVFRFDEHCLNFIYEEPVGTMEWNGQTVSVSDFRRSTMNDVCNRIARKTAAMKMVFREDATVEIALQKSANADFVHWVTLPYFVKYSDAGWGCDVWLELTKEQGRYFNTYCLGTPDAGESPVVAYAGFSDRYKLGLTCLFYKDKGREYLSCGISPFGVSAFSRYIRTWGSEGISPEEQAANMKLLDLMYDNQEFNWLPLLYSENYLMP